MTNQPKTRKDFPNNCAEPWILPSESKLVSMEEPVAAGATAGGESDAPGLSPEPKGA